MKKNLYQPILINTTLIICFSFSLYGLAIDLPLIHENLRSTYIAGRIVSAVICAFFFFQVNVQKKQYEAQVPLIYSTIILYCVQGQYFVNGYYLAFMQAIAGFSLFFPMPKKYYYPITFLGNVLILVSIWKSLFLYSEVASKNLKFNVDTSFGITLISIICLIGYQNITLAREQKQVLAEKFLDIGRSFGNLIHDLKSMSSAPIVYSELLAKEVDKDLPNLKYLKEISDNLKIDITNMHEKILSINKLSKNSRDVSRFDVKALIEATQKNFFSKDNLAIDILGDTTEIVSNEFSLRSILLNLLNNSKENFVARHSSNRIIQIIIEPQKITFKDNGGGFSKEALSRVNKGSFFSEKTNGSGMGLFTVREYMREFSGKAYFKNRTDGVAGAQIELYFAQPTIS